MYCMWTFSWEDDIMFWLLCCMAFRKPSDLFWSSASLFFREIIDKMMQSSFANKDWINVNRCGNVISRSMFVTYIYEQPSYSAETGLCGEKRPMIEWQKKLWNCGCQINLSSFCSKSNTVPNCLKLIYALLSHLNGSPCSKIYPSEQE